MNEELDEYEGLPEELARKLAGMAKWNNKTLWKTARDSHLSTQEADKLQTFQHKREFKPLTQAEVELKDKLLQKYEDCMLIRAQAVALLHKRGVDVLPLRRVR